MVLKFDFQTNFFVGYLIVFKFGALITDGNLSIGL